ncbi:MAG: ATP-binding protein [Desulfobacterales bacterium]|nr:ATP-binding protein [Desulfobacterales bacterium]
MDKHRGPYRALNRQVGRALVKYRMIAAGDRILVGLSGGKDSITLLYTLLERRARTPVAYDILPVHIDPGFEGGCAEALRERCRQLGTDLRVEYTDYGPQGHHATNRENPCFLCSRLRRNRLFEIARETGCRKVALGHTRDDIIETFFMNICFAGETSTMLPAQPLFNGRLTVIRPLAFVDEDLIHRFVNRMGFTPFDNPCPSATRSSRSEIKALLRQLYRRNPKVKGNIFRAMGRVRMDYMLKP